LLSYPRQNIAFIQSRYVVFIRLMPVMILISLQYNFISRCRPYLACYLKSIMQVMVNMNIAIPVWKQNISTVFDYSDRVMIFRIRSGRIIDECCFDICGTSGVERVNMLRQIGADVLLCGAISMPLERMITASGVTVVPFLKGTIRDIINAYLTGNLPNPHFSLPGCRRAGWRRRGMRSRMRGRHGNW